MNKIICRGYRFPPEIIQRAIWLYYRFTLSLRDVKELLAERGIEVTYETIRQWGIRFGPAIARDLRSRRPRPHSRWHMDEMFVSIGGKRVYLWRQSQAAQKRSFRRMASGIGRCSINGQDTDDSFAPCDQVDKPGTFEGGDFNVIEEGCVLIGCGGARTQIEAARQVEGWFKKE